MTIPNSVTKIERLVFGGCDLLSIHIPALVTSIEIGFYSTFYGNKLGIPSFLWAMTHNKLFPNKGYYWFYPEKWANKLAGIER